MAAASPVSCAGVMIAAIRPPSWRMRTPRGFSPYGKIFSPVSTRSRYAERRSQTPDGPVASSPIVPAPCVGAPTYWRHAASMRKRVTEPAASRFDISAIYVKLVKWRPANASSIPQPKCSASTAIGSPRWSSSRRSPASPGRRSIITSPSKEALFRAVVEAVYEGAFEAERAAGLKQEQAGKGLADILAAQLEARFRYLFDLIKGLGPGRGAALRAAAPDARPSPDLPRPETEPDRRRDRARLRRGQGRFAEGRDAGRARALRSSSPRTGSISRRPTQARSPISTVPFA